MLTINLGLEEKKMPVDQNFDAVAAVEAIAQAESALVACETEAAILTTAVESLERGQQLSKAIAEKTGDNAVAMTVGAEALKTSLAIIGQAKLADQIVAGAESYEAGTEAAGDVLKKMMDKAKEYAKKAWEFVRNLIIKVVKFVKGVFGKGDDTAEQLKKLLKKAKDDKRTNLKATEFETNVAERLAKQVKLMVAEAGSKGVDDAAIKAHVDTMKTLVDGLSTDVDLSVTLDDKLKAEDVAAADVKAAIEAGLGEDVKAILTKGTKTVDSDIKGYIEEKVKDAIVEDADAYIVKLIANNGDAATVQIVELVGAADDLEAVAKADLKGKEAISAYKKLVNKIRVRTLSVAPEWEDIKEYAEKLAPVPFSSAESIVKELAGVAKSSEKKGDKSVKAVEKAEKTATKALDALTKELEGPSAAAAELMKVVLDVKSKYKLVHAKATANVLMDAARPKFGDIIKESVRLYEK